MTVQYLLATLCITAIASPAPTADEGGIRVLYVGAESDSSHGLLERWCDVQPGAIGGLSYALGGKTARDVSSLQAGDLQALKAVFLDADAAAGMREADAAALGEYVRSGGRLVIEGCDAYLPSLGAILPVEAAPRQACAREAVAAEPDHPALLGIPLDAWDVSGWESASQVKPGARVIVQAGDRPLVVVGTTGAGKVIATPLTHEEARYSWLKTPGYDSLLALLTLAVAMAPDEVVLQESWASAYRYWMYGCFSVGYHKYRFGAGGSAVAAYDEAEMHLTAARKALESKDTARCADLIRRAVEASGQAARGAGQLGGGLTPDDVRAASLRRDLLRLPGPLDVVHGMNVSEGPRGSDTFWYPGSGRELLDERPNLDLPPGTSASFWRGLHSYIIGSGILPTEPDADRLWQQSVEGTRIDGPNREIWIHPAVKTLQAQTFGDAHEGAIINQAGGADWLTYGTSPGADFSQFAQAAFRVYLAEQGLSPDDLGAGEWEEVVPPGSWAPGRLYYEWQRFRRLYLRERLKSSYWAIKLVAPDALAALQPGALMDPWRVGVGAEESDYLDLLCPLILRDSDAAVDPAQVEVACRELWSLTDADGDGAHDQGLGYAARPAWGDPLALAPPAHRSVAGIALLCGAHGIMHTWAPDGRGGDAIASVPEEVFMRWHAAFEPAVRHESLLLAGKPARATVGVWQSWHSAAMAEGAGEPGGADTWALSQPREWCEVLIRAGLTPRLLYDRHIEEDNLLGLPCIVVPSTLCVSDDEVGVLTRFCEEGGTLLLGCGAGTFDAYHQARPGGLGKLAGLTTGPPSAGSERVQGKLTAAVAKKAGSNAVTMGEVTQPVQSIEGASELASGAAGALICSRRLGKGTVIYLTATVWAGDGPTQMVIRNALADAGVQPQASLRNAEGDIEWRARCLVMDCGSRILVGLVHYQPYPEQEPLKAVQVAVRTGKGRYAVHRLSDARPYVRDDTRREKVESSSSDGYTSFKTDLPPCGLELFLVESA
jgi:hypothetical protein